MFKFLKNIFEDKQETNTNRGIPIIDASNDMNFIIKELIKNYKSFVNYNEIQSINQKHQLAILKFVWNNWNIHSYGKKLIEAFPEYDEKTLLYIYQKETARILMYYHRNKYLECLKKPYMNFYISCKKQSDINKDYKNNVKYHKEIYICNAEDMDKVFDKYSNNDGKFEHITFSPLLSCNDSYKKLEKIFYFQDNDFKVYSTDEFKIFCEANNYKYPFYKKVRETKVEKIKKEIKLARMALEKTNPLNDEYKIILEHLEKKEKELKKYME